MATDVGQMLDQITERAARRAYERNYRGLRWEDASPQGRAAAYSNLKAVDVLAVIETDLTLAAALRPGATP